MALYKLGKMELIAVESQSMALLKVRERQDLQRLLRNTIEVISKDTLIISEEYTGWIGSQRRIDLLGIDPDGTLVVFELKRTEDGGHMDLQGIRYAAMASVLTFKEVVEAFDAYLKRTNPDADAEVLLLDHLNLDSDNLGNVGKDVRIVLASADFGREVTTTALWLNEKGLNIKCFRMVPYQDGDSIYLDVQQIIPVPEAADYMIKKRVKEEEKRVAESEGQRDFTRFIVSHGGIDTAPLPKRRAILEMVKILVSAGISPKEMQLVFGRNRFLVANAEYSTEKGFSSAAIQNLVDGSPTAFNGLRYFTGDEDLLNHRGKTFAFSNQWGSKTRDAMTQLIERYPGVGISLKEVP